MELTFEDLLYEYESQLCYIKRMIEPKTLSVYNMTKEYWEGYYYAVFHWFETMKDYCTDFDPLMREATIKEEQEFLYENQPPCGVLDYRGVRAPVYDDDYGQQLFMVFRGQIYGGGAFNTAPERDFCYIIDGIIDREFALGGTDDENKKE